MLKRIMEMRKCGSGDGERGGGGVNFKKSFKSTQLSRGNCSSSNRQISAGIKAK